LFSLAAPVAGNAASVPVLAAPIAAIVAAVPVNVVNQLVATLDHGNAASLVMQDCYTAMRTAATFVTDELYGPLSSEQKTEVFDKLRALNITLNDLQRQRALMSFVVRRWVSIDLELISESEKDESIAVQLRREQADAVSSAALRQLLEQREAEDEQRKARWAVIKTATTQVLSAPRS
jgi:hypothetical protein